MINEPTNTINYDGVMTLPAGTYAVVDPKSAFSGEDFHRLLATTNDNFISLQTFNFESEKGNIFNGIAVPFLQGNHNVHFDSGFLIIAKASLFSGDPAAGGDLILEFKEPFTIVSNEREVTIGNVTLTRDCVIAI